MPVGEERLSRHPSFVLAGNGPYLNRGCEAIVRGTVDIIRTIFGSSSFTALSFFEGRKQFFEQASSEYDEDIEHKPIKPFVGRYNPLRGYYKLKRILGVPDGKVYYEANRDIICSSDAVLSIGGDNYSLDYGMPWLFTIFDDYVLSLQRPLILWGASVGPFHKAPDYEVYMKEHLRRATAIFARESITVEYLDRLGVRTNVYLVADPAFMMKPLEIPGFHVEEDAIGLNFSPLMAKFATAGNMALWRHKVAEILTAVRKRYNKQIYLIPHVTISGNDDHVFMQEALDLLDDRSGIILAPATLNAQATKWLISKLRVFAGARTHATIAALSSGIPTLTFGYSIKAHGINRDLYGNDDYCLEADQCEANPVIERLTDLFENHAQKRAELCARLEAVQARALLNGAYLQRVLM